MPLYAIEGKRPTLADDVWVAPSADVIGENCLIGANALVTEGKVFPAGSLIVGSPAKAVRELSPEAIAGLKMSAAAYAAKQRVYAEGLRLVEV